MGVRVYSKTLDTRFSDKINYAYKKVIILVLAEVVHCFTRKKKRKKEKKEEKTWIKSNRRQENFLTVDRFQSLNTQESLYIYIYFRFISAFSFFLLLFPRWGGGVGGGPSINGFRSVPRFSSYNHLLLRFIQDLGVCYEKNVPSI